MVRFSLIGMLAALALLGGCDRNELQPDRTPPKSHVWQDQVDTIDKARAAGKTVEQAGVAQAKEIDDQTR